MFFGASTFAPLYPTPVPNSLSDSGLRGVGGLRRDVWTSPPALHPLSHLLRLKGKDYLWE